MMQRVDDRRTFAPLASGWAWVAASGVLLLIAGVAALLAPSLTVVTFSIFIGWLLLLVGVAGIVLGLRTRTHGRWGDLLQGIASLVAGVLIVFNPLAGALSLTMVIAIWFGLRGGIELGGAVRAGPGRARTMLAIIGVIDVLIAASLIANYPFPAMRAIGLVIGFGFLMAGAATLAAGLQLRRITH